MLCSFVIMKEKGKKRKNGQKNTITHTKQTNKQTIAEDNLITRIIG